MTRESLNLNHFCEYSCLARAHRSMSSLVRDGLMAEDSLVCSIQSVGVTLGARRKAELTAVGSRKSPPRQQRYFRRCRPAGKRFAEADVMMPSDRINSAIYSDQTTRRQVFKSVHGDCREKR